MSGTQLLYFLQISQSWNMQGSSEEGRNARPRPNSIDFLFPLIFLFWWGIWSPQVSTRRLVDQTVGLWTEFLAALKRTVGVPSVPFVIYAIPDQLLYEWFITNKTRHGGGFHRSRKMLGHNGEWFGPQEGLLYHFIPKQKFFYFKIFFKCCKMP